MRRHTRTHGPAQGFTLVESLIAVTFLAVLFLAVAQTSSRASDAFDEGSTEHALTTSAHRGLERIARAIELSDGTINGGGAITGGSGANDITFGTPLEFVGGNVTWQPTRIFSELESGELDDGVDNNGNGLIDEQHVVLIEASGLPDERRVVLVSGVAKLLQGEGVLANGSDDNDNGLTDESGLTFSSDGSVITVRMTCQRRDEAGRLLTKTVETAVRLLNSGG